MGAKVVLLLLTILCTSVSSVRGVCRRIRNDDMIEYSCTGGQVSDLNDLPPTTGKLRIMMMQIDRITASTFARFGSDLWVLGCSQCGIVDIEPGAFQHLQNLEQLSLDNNHLSIIRESWFRGLTYLTYLDLNHNRIRMIEDGVFRNLPGLVDLRLSGNRLQCLNFDDVSTLKELKRIFLNENYGFKCPNSATNFFENHGINFDSDPEWDKIPVDLVSAVMPSEYDSYEWTSVQPPIARTSIYDEEPYVPPTISFEESETPYTSRKFYPTEEIVHPSEIVTPSLKTTPTLELSTSREWYTTPRPTNDYRTTFYAPPPVDSYRDDEATQSSLKHKVWPTIVSISTVETESPMEAAHVNEEDRHQEPRYPSEFNKPPWLATSPPLDRETTSSTEADVEHTTDTNKAYWTNNENGVSTSNGIDDRARYSIDSIQTSRIPDVRPLSTEGPEGQDSSPTDSYGPPMTTLSPLENYQQNREGHPSSNIPSMETTTDKPLPDCPNTNSATSIEPLKMITTTVFCLMAMSNVLVERF